MAEDRKHLHAVLAMSTGDFSTAADLLQQQLVVNPDDWACLQLYMDALLPGTAAGPRADSPLLGFSGGLAQVTWAAGEGAHAEGAVLGSGVSMSEEVVAAALKRAAATIDAMIAQVGVAPQLQWSVTSASD